MEFTLLGKILIAPFGAIMIFSVIAFCLWAEGIICNWRRLRRFDKRLEKRFGPKWWVH